MEGDEQLRGNLESRIGGIERLSAELRALLEIAGTGAGSEDKLRAGIESRLGELEVLRDELTAVLSAEPSDSDSGTSPSPSPRRAGSRGPYQRRSRGAKPSRDGRAPYGTNRDRILDLALANPGITSPEIAEQTGIKSRVVSATVSRMKSRGDLEGYRGGVRVPDAASAIA
jgi:hypothetical protein